MNTKSLPTNPETASQQQPQAPAKQPKRGSKLLQTILIPVLAVLTGFIIGAIVIALSNDAVIAAYRNFFHAPWAAVAATWNAIAQAYGALFYGSFGSITEIYHGLQSYIATGDSKAILKAIYPFAESLTAVTPYILAGLAVAVGFKCGLFNIGAEGQFGIGALCSAFVGYSLHGLPWYIHLPLALLAGAAGGALWGAIPGYLKGLTGAHEVVNTIMMNYISFLLSDWLLNGPMKARGFRPLTPVIDNSAMLPRFFPDPIRLNWGFILALVVAVAVYWFLFKTTVGFEIRAVGANPDGARYAGMNIVKNFVIAMTLSGALAGLAGATQVLGVDHWVGQGFSAGYGFDSIAIALLGQSHPLGVVLAAFLWGTLRSGATNMQLAAGVPIEIISIIQGLVIVFVAAPAVIRWIYRIRAIRTETTVLTRGWGK
ncbi:MAG TPA: ABC transporter permease [Anaerolineales bacterium]|nr:ABC transporter permease [Anaerolineales bacterium]